MVRRQIPSGRAGRARFLPVRFSSVGIVALAFASGSLCAAPALAGPPTAGTYDLVLTAKVRDFPGSHPDFCKPPTFGQNWVEGAVATTLDAQGRPKWLGAGRRVTVPAKDAAGNNISGNLLAETPPPPPPDISLSQPATLVDNSWIDTYNPLAGPYGGGNVGGYPAMATGQPMPTVTVPTITPVIGEYKRDGAGLTTLAAGFRCDKFLISNSHVLTIVGDVTVVVSEAFALENSGRIELAPLARLTIYALKDAKFHNNVKANMNTGDASRFTFYKLGAPDLFIQDSSQVCATIICPTGRVFMQNSADLFGLVTTKTLHMQNGAGVHVPQPPANPPCSVFKDDKAATLGAADSAAVSSGQSFGNWFKDAPGVNMESQARMLFSKDQTGALTFATNDFRPIDGELLDEGSYAPNRNFTMEMEGGFTYSPCTGQFFEFFGDGDAFVYVDGVLVAEMAGNNMGAKQYVDFDRLSLDPTVPHEVKFFYAQRSCGASRFSVRTNVELRTEYVVETETIALLD